MRTTIQKIIQAFNSRNLFPVLFIFLTPMVLQKEGCNKDKAPQCTQISSPSDGDSNVAVDQALSWPEPDGDPTGYTIRIGTATGSGDIVNNVNVGDVLSYAHPVSLPQGSDIFVNVTAFNDAGDATGCDEVRFTTAADALPIPVPPECTQLTNPADGATNISASQSLNWSPAGGNPTGYRVRIGTTAGAGDIVNNQNVGNTISFTPSNPLPEGDNIFVTITAFNANGDASGCNEVRFSTISPVTELPSLYVRQNINDLWNQNPNHPVIETYKEAVTLMKALPANHPHSWAMQASIHQNHCDHATWYFLPWHRAYLMYFEDVIREVTGDNTFALPYWDWSDPQRIPDAYFSGSLNNMSRDANQGQTISSWAFTQEMLDRIMNTQDFEAFGSFEAGAFGELEGSAHNNIHVWVGGDMGSVATAGLDPLFWCHHANVDRVWALWNQDGNVNSDDTDWLDHTFVQHFFDDNGDPVNVQVSEMVSTYRLGDMSYRYDDQDATEPPLAVGDLPGIFEKIAGMDFAASSVAPVGVNTPVTVQLNPTPSFFTRMDAVLEQPEDELLDEMVYLEIRGVKPPANEDVIVGVFLNSNNINSNTRQDHPNFVGTFSFFLHGDDHGGGGNAGFNYYFDLTPTLRSLEGTSTFPQNNIKVQLMALTARGNPSTATFTPGEMIISIVKRKV